MGRSGRRGKEWGSKRERWRREGKGVTGIGSNRVIKIFGRDISHGLWDAVNKPNKLTFW